MIFRFCQGCSNRPRHYADWLCWQVSTMLAFGIPVGAVRFLLSDAVHAAAKGTEIESEGGFRA